MANENDNKGSVLNILFESREELSKTPQSLENVKNSLDSYIDKINIIGAYENEKFYKIRFFRCNEFDTGMCGKIKIKFI